MPAQTFGASGPIFTPVTESRAMRLWGPRAGITYSSGFPSFALTSDVYRADEGHTGSTTLPQSDPNNGLVVRPRPQGAVLAITPVMLGSVGDTMDLRVSAWHQFIGDGNAGNQWFQIPLIVFTAVAGAKTGIASGLLDDSWLYASSFTGIADYTGSYYAVSGSTGPAMLFVDPGHAALIQIDMRINTTPTAVNCIAGGLTAL